MSRQRVYQRIDVVKLREKTCDAVSTEIASFGLCQPTIQIFPYLVSTMYCNPTQMIFNDLTFS